MEIARLPLMHMHLTPCSDVLLLPSKAMGLSVQGWLPRLQFTLTARSESLSRHGSAVSPRDGTKKNEGLIEVKVL